MLKKPEQGASADNTAANDKTVIVPNQNSKSDSIPDDKTVFVAQESVNAQSRSSSSSTPDDRTVIVESSASSDKTHISSKPYERKPIGGATSPQQVGASQSRVIRNRFQLDSLLGSGGMGSVWLALDQRKIEAKDPYPYVAVKLLNEDFKSHKEAFVSLQRETQKSQTLAHPNIVTVYDFDRDGDNTVFMTMEYLKGHPLDKILKDASGHGLDQDQAMSIIRDISSALIYAHSHGIIHSDFKPGNIFVTESGTAKVLDFGIARVAAESSESSSSKKQDTFDAGIFSALTPAYASFEMFERRDPDPSDDVYALACVAYEMLSGRHPYDRKPANSKDLPELQRIQFLTRWQWQALEKALKIRREERTPSVGEFVHQFFKKRTNPLIYVVAAVLALAIGGGVYFQVQKREAELLAVAEQEAAAREEAAKQEQRFDNIKSQLERHFSDVELDRNILREDWKQETEAYLEAYKNFPESSEQLISDYRYSASNKFLDLAREKLVIDDISSADLEQVAANITVADAYISEARYWTITNPHIDEVVGEKALAQLSLDTQIQALADAEQARLIAQQRREQAALQASQKKKYQRELQAAESNVKSHFQCSQDLDVAGVPGDAVLNFRSRYPKESAALESGLAKEMANCVTQVAKRNPVKANRILQSSLALFSGSAAAFADVSIDYCGHIRTGSGRLCRDPIVDGKRPPVMVVVPSAENIDIKLAISRSEISNSDVISYCKSTGKCSVPSDELPATNLTAAQMEGYAKWLSELTGNTYRLPTLSEWSAAANGRSRREDPNRNCFLRFNGITKGDSLVTADSGLENDYGLINYSGNAQELVKNGSGYSAVGGSIEDPMSRCTVETVHDHDGSADAITGFRVVRNVN